VLAQLPSPRIELIDDGLRRRLSWVTGLRLVVLTTLLGATFFFYLRGKLTEYPETLRIVYVTIGVAYALAAVQGAVLRSGKRLRELAFVQLALDQILWSAIVYVSGGASSGATSFYGLTVLVGAMLVGLRGAVFSAAIGGGLYGAMCLGFALGKLHPPSDQLATSFARTPAELTYPILINALGIVIVTALASYLAERLRTTGGALALATQRYNEAERLAELGRIAAWLAHEIRNPLGSIKGSVELLRESSALESEDKQLCDIILREATRLNDLVGDMVDLSKPRKAKAEAVDVAEVARDVVELANKPMGPKGSIKVVYVGPEGGVRAKCDGAQIRQVVWNLVRNAIQSSNPDTTVTVRLEADEHSVTLAVDDQGPGVSGDVKARIFDAFYTTRSHGTGIGLAVVKRIMDDHARFGASIDVVSHAGGGASFRVVLNRDVAGLKASLPPPRPARAS
jgi:two-component system, NtrC family, sensor histidine kinase HydH